MPERSAQTLSASVFFAVDIRREQGYVERQIRRTEKCGPSSFTSEGVLLADFPKNRQRPLNADGEVCPKGWFAFIKAKAFRATPGTGMLSH
jgi:hypothetical protein